MKTIVYRCEDKDKRGPYWAAMNSPYIVERQMLLSKSASNLPTPWEDKDIEASIPVNQQMDYNCGFISLNQMNNWFTKTEQKKLRELGWKFLKLEVTSDVHVGKMQCIFKRKDAKIIKEIKI